jgi:quercetin dioxygenase-like cupin family protein
MFVKHNDEGYRTLMEGIRMKTLAYGATTHMARFQLDKGTLMPLHAHPNEQTGILLSGHLIFNIDGETFETVPGDSWSIPPDVEHGVEVLEDSVIIEVFSPVREAYL